MKKITLIFVVLTFVCNEFYSCSGSGNDKNVSTKNDPLDSAKIVTDSIKKIEDAKPKFLVIQGTNVNMRVEPNIKAVRIRQLTTGDTCEVIEKGNKDTVNDIIDFWYKIKRKTKEGWIFGEFTSLKLKEEKQNKSNIFIPAKKND